jgi:putative ABC transport system substrate-binding protein
MKFLFRRREFIAAIAALLVSPQRLRAQGTPRRIGYLGTRFNAAYWQSFLDALREHGWEDGRNIIVEGRWAEARPERYVELASELVSLKMDVIVASAPPAVRAVQQATRTIPIIMTAVADPVDMGFVKSLAEPGGNITGVASTAGAGLISKLLELTKDALPSAKRVGILFNEGNPLNYITPAEPEISAAAKALDLEILWLPIRAVADLEPALATAKQRGADAIIGSGDPLLFAERAVIHDIAERNRLPTIWPTREYLSGRGLLSYGPTLEGMLRHAAVYVDRILRGAQPATTPVEQPTGYQLVINLRTGKTLGLTVPPSLLARADEVIE